MHRLKKKQAGLSLAELMVSAGLLSVVSLVTLQLYLSAQTEFQYASGNMTLSQRVRTTSDRITQYLKTACAPNPQTSTLSPFKHPDFATEPGRELYEADFISSVCFMRDPAKGSVWQVAAPNPAPPLTPTSGSAEAYVGDAANPRYIYETDSAFTAPVLRFPSLYRYRIAWNPQPTAAYTQSGRNIPPRAVYVERLTYGELGDPNAGTGSTTTYNGVPLRNFLPDTGTPIAGVGRSIIAPVVHLLSFNAYSSNVVLMRIRIYDRDPENPNRNTEGIVINRSGYGGTRDRSTGRQRFHYVEMVTNIQVPNLTMK